MAEGIIIKALSGFYYVSDGEKVVSCRAKGRFRHVSTSPLVGDHVSFVPVTDSTGVIEAIAPRRNSFIRPAVANIDCLVFVASAAKPVTDPYLIDRVSVIADRASCETVVCINKCDLSDPEELSERCREILDIQTLGLCTRLEHINCKTAAVHIIRKDKAVSPVLSFHLICHISFGSFKSLTCDLPNALVRAKSTSATDAITAEANGQTTVRIVSVKAVPS